MYLFLLGEKTDLGDGVVDAVIPIGEMDVVDL